MADQPIKSTDIIENGLFNDAIKQADIFLEKARDIEGQLKNNLATSREYFSSFKGEGAKSLQDLNKETVKVTATLKEYESTKLGIAEIEKKQAQLRAEVAKATKEEIKLTQELAKEEAKRAKEFEKQNSEYKKASDNLRDLKKQLKDLSIAGKEDTKEFKELNKQFELLDAKVRKADSSVGDFQRNVGNYPQQLREIQRELQKLDPGTKKFNELAIKAGELKDKIGDAKDATKAFATESKATQAKNLFGQIGSDIADLDFKGAAEKAATFSSVMKSITLTEVVSGLKSFGTAIIDMGKSIIASPIGLFVATIAAAATAFKLYRDTVNEVYEAQSDLNAQMRESNMLLEKNRAEAEKTANKTLELQGKIGEKEAKIRDLVIDSNLKQAEAKKKYQDDVKALLADEEINEVMRVKKLLQLTKDYSIQAAFENRIAKQNILNVTLEANKKELEAEKKHKEDKLKAERDLQNELTKIRIDNTELDKRREIDNAKNENRLAKERLKESKGTEETKAKLRVEYDEKLRQELIAINDKYAKQDADRIAKENEDKLKAQQDADKKLNDSIDKQTANANALYEERTAKENKRAADRKAKRDKERQELIEFEQQLLDAIAEADAAKSQERQDAFDKQISDTEQNIETQRRLAEKGQANTLAEEEARKIQLERQKEQEKQEEIKRQKVLAFFKLYSAYAEKDPDNALQKALKDTILAEAVAAAFIEGTENVANDPQFNKHKYKNGEDGYIARFDGRERILNPEQNAKIGGLSNDELADLAHKANNGLLDTVRYAAIPTDNFAINIANSALLMETVALKKEMQEVKQAIKEIPVPSFRFDDHGNFIAEEIQNGFTKATKHKFKRPKLG